jgi:hypothetical protein
MDKNLETGEKKKTEIESANDCHRLTINRDAENALVKTVDRINNGFNGGKVNRNQVAVWILLRHLDGLSDEDVRTIRSEHLDEFSALDAILRRAKQSGELPIEIRSFIQKEMGFDETPKKKSKKTLQSSIINDDTSP